MSPSSARLRVALGEYDTGWHDPARSLARAREVAGLARAAEADALLLPEICASGFTMDADHFAEPADGVSARALSALAADALSLGVATIRACSPPRARVTCAELP